MRILKTTSVLALLMALLVLVSCSKEERSNHTPGQPDQADVSLQLAKKVARNFGMPCTVENGGPIKIYCK